MYVWITFMYSNPPLIRIRGTKRLFLSPKSSPFSFFHCFQALFTLKIYTYIKLNMYDMPNIIPLICNTLNIFLWWFIQQYLFYLKDYTTVIWSGDLFLRSLSECPLCGRLMSYMQTQQIWSLHLSDNFLDF